MAQPRLIEKKEKRVRVQFTEVSYDPATGKLKRGETYHLTALGLTAKQAVDLFKKVLLSGH